MSDFGLTSKASEKFQVKPLQMNFQSKMSKLQVSQPHDAVRQVKIFENDISGLVPF